MLQFLSQIQSKVILNKEDGRNPMRSSGEFFFFHEFSRFFFDDLSCRSILQMWKKPKTRDMPSTPCG